MKDEGSDTRRQNQVEAEGPEEHEARSLAALGVVRPFSRLCEDELRGLVRLTRHLKVRARCQITTVDAHRDAAMILVSGRAKLSLLSAHGEEFILEILESGDLFFEHALVAPVMNTVYVEALASCTIMQIPGSAARAAINRCPAAIAELARVLRDKLDQRNELINALRSPLDERITWRLSRLAERHGSVTPDRLVINHGLSQRDLAATVGVSRESFNRHLATLAREGLFEVCGRKIVVSDQEAITRLSTGRAHTGPRTGCFSNSATRPPSAASRAAAR